MHLAVMQWGLPEWHRHHDRMHHPLVHHLEGHAHAGRLSLAFYDDYPMLVHHLGGSAHCWNMVHVPTAHWTMVGRRAPL